MTAKPARKIVLMALPRPQKPASPRRPSATAAQHRNATPDAAPDAPTFGLMLALEDLQVLAGHVSALLDDAALNDIGIGSWLGELDNVLGAIRSAIGKGWIISREDLSIEDEGAADLHEVLARRPSAEDVDWPETGQSRLLVRLVDYWLDQIGERGHSLLHLLIGADDVLEAARSLTALGGIRYPFR